MWCRPCQVLTPCGSLSERIAYKSKVNSFPQFYSSEIHELVVKNFCAAQPTMITHLRYTTTQTWRPRHFPQPQSEASAEFPTSFLKTLPRIKGPHLVSRATEQPSDSLKVRASPLWNQTLGPSQFSKLSAHSPKLQASP